MPTRSFKKPATKAAAKKGSKEKAAAVREKVTAPPTEEKALATTKAKGGALTKTPANMGDDVSGEVDSSDIKLPYLAIVQGIGDLSALFAGGQLILAGEVELVPPPAKDKPTEAIEIAIVWARKQFLEKLPWGSEEMPRIFDTAEAAKVEGLTTEWVDNEPPSAGPMLTCLVLVPETKLAAKAQSPYYTLDYDGKKFAPCLWRLKSTAYNRAGKAILTAKALSKRDPFCSRKFMLSTKREKVGENWIFTPVVRAAGKNDQEFVDFVAANAQ